VYKVFSVISWQNSVELCIWCWQICELVVHSV